jgi:hypothetical protein
MIRTAAGRARGAVARAVARLLDYNDRWVLAVHEPWQGAGRAARCGGPHRVRAPEWPCRAWSAAADRRSLRQGTRKAPVA